MKNTESPDTIIQFFTSPAEWAAAKWRATAFLYDPSGLSQDPPALCLAFENFGAAKQIFDGWIKRVGHFDVHEELRISIIEGPIHSDLTGYTVLVSSNPLHTVDRKQLTEPDFHPNRFVRSSQLNRMDPAPGSPHLRLFKSHFARLQRYHLVPAHFARGQIRDLDLNRYIEKRELNLFHSSELKPGQVEYAAFDGA